MRIANNLPALTAYNSLNATNNVLQKTIQQLSTGLRINSASDDAAGFAISEKMRSQISGLDVALRNSQDGISFLQTAEGALGQTNSMLQRMRELAVQASNDSLTSNDRQYIQLEIDELKNQIDKISDTTQFNRKRLLDGSSGAIWSSSDSKVKAKINGGLTYIDEYGQKQTAEGNYKIEVKTEGGQGQVQKTSMMFIKHKNVIMDRAINIEAGINNVEVDDLPPGYYEINGEPPTEAHAFVTGAYGIELDELDQSLTSTVRNSYLLNNASILFEVTDVDEDYGITVRATANILKTDGTSDIARVDNITLREGKYNDLSEILKVGNAGSDSDKADGAFELRLQNGAAGNFEVGDKFVYNLTVAEGVEGADRTINIKDDNTTNETQEVYKTNIFLPKERISVPARVLFLIDDSGSMQEMIDTVRDNVVDFVSTIVGNGADDVKIGVASYSDWHANTTPTWFQKHTMNGSDWSKDLDEIKDALNEITPTSGLEDHYKAIRDAIDSYGISANDDPTFIVLVTDAPQEKSGNGTKQDAIDALINAGVSCSFVRPEIAQSDYDDIAAQTDGLVFNQKSTTWGNELSNELGKKIGEEALNEALFNATPLYEFEQFQGTFMSENSLPTTITITIDGVDHDIIIEPTDTLKTFSEKLDSVVGQAKLEVNRDIDNNNLGVMFAMDFPSGTSIKFSGDKELLNTIGFRSNFEHKFSLDASEVMNKKVHMRQFYIDSQDGHVYNSDVILTTDDDKEIAESEFYSKFEAAYIGQVPKHDVRLRDINKTWDSQGVFLLDSPQKIKITQGDGQAVEIALYETDTIEDVRKKLNDAIADGLGQGKYAPRDKFVSFVPESQVQNMGDETVPGTFIIRSAIPGKVGELHFSGDEDLLNTLGLNTIQESDEATYSVTIKNAHTGKVIDANLKMTGNVIHGVIDPDIDVDIEFDSMAGLKATWDENSKSFIISHDEIFSAMLHLKDNSTAFQIGANQGEDFLVQIGDCSVNALGISSVNVTTRETASRAIGIIDSAINKISSQRAKIGAYQNALEHTMENLTVTSLNLTAAESRIRDADMSKTMMEFVKLQILNQSGSSMLAQANQLPNSVLSLL